jgi:hypothetical protein
MSRRRNGEEKLGFALDAVPALLRLDGRLGKGR